MAGEGDQPVRDFAVTAFGRFRRKVKRVGRDLAHVDDAIRHGVRKDAKKLGYASEFFANLFDRKRETRATGSSSLRSKRFRTSLAHDVAKAPLMLEKLGVTDEPDVSKCWRRGRGRGVRIDMGGHGSFEGHRTRDGAALCKQRREPLSSRARWIRGW